MASCRIAYKTLAKCSFQSKLRLPGLFRGINIEKMSIKAITVSPLIGVFKDSLGNTVSGTMM